VLLLTLAGALLFWVMRRAGEYRETLRRKAILVPSVQLVPLHSTHFQEQESVEDVPTSSAVVEAPFADVSEGFGNERERRGFTPFSKEDATSAEPVEATERSLVDDASALPFGRTEHSNEPYTTETVQREEVDDENSSEGQAIREQDQQLINQEAELDAVTQSESASEEAASVDEQESEETSATKQEESANQEYESAGDGAEESSDGNESEAGHHRHRFQDSAAPVKPAPRASKQPTARNRSQTLPPSKSTNRTRALPVSKQPTLTKANSASIRHGTSYRAKKKRDNLARERQREIALRAQQASKMKLKEIPPNMRAIPSPDLLKSNVLQLDDTEDMYSQMGLQKFTGVVVSYINANPNWADVAVRTDGDDLLKVMVKNRGLELLEHIGQRIIGWAMTTPLPGKAKLLDIHKYETA